MTKRIRSAVSVLIMTVIASVLLPAGALAVPQPPHRFHGMVMVAGSPAPDGLTITAVIPGAAFSYTPIDATAGGRFGDGASLFKVPADNSDTPAKEGGVDGDIVLFYVAGVAAGSYSFEVGGSTEVNLVIPAPPALDEPGGVRRTSAMNDSTPTFTWDEVSGAGAYQVRVDGGIFLDVGGIVAITLSALADGDHWFGVRAVDASGMPGTSSPPVAFIVDTVAPGVEMTPVTSGAAGGLAELVGGATDATTVVSRVEFRVDDGAWIDAAPSDEAFDSLMEGFVVALPALGAGPHTVYIRATDAAGNTTAPAGYAVVELTLGGSPAGAGAESPAPVPDTAAADSEVTDDEAAESTAGGAEHEEPAPAPGTSDSAPAVVPGDETHQAQDESAARFTVGRPALAAGVAEIGDLVVVVVDVRNGGGTAGSYEAVLRMDGEVAGRADVVLRAGERRRIAFTVRAESAGTHRLEVAGQSTALVVRTAQQPSMLPGGAAAASANRWLPAVVIGLLGLAGVVVWIVVLRQRGPG